MKSFEIMLLAAAFILLPYLFFQRNFNFIASKEPDAQNCYKAEEQTVRGASLSGLIEEGSKVKILFGYYDCNEIKRGDVVVYNFSGDKNPIIKIVKGLPSDKFHLQETNGAWNILINGETVKNSKGEPYSLSERGSKMLSLYERDYKGVIPANTYMILGNLASGSLDSSRFGLVGKSDILGKVELNKF